MAAATHRPLPADVRHHGRGGVGSAPWPRPGWKLTWPFRNLGFGTGLRRTGLWSRMSRVRVPSLTPSCLAGDLRVSCLPGRMALIALLSTVPWVEVTVGAQGRNWRADLVVPTLSDIDGCDLAGHRSASRSHRGNAAG